MKTTHDISTDVSTSLPGAALRDADAAALGRALAAGDRAAFGELARRARAGLLNDARRVLGGRDGADDVVQAGLAAAWRLRDTLDPARGDGFDAWARVIVCNQARNAWRATARRARHEVLLDADPPEAHGDGDAEDTAAAALDGHAADQGLDPETAASVRQLFAGLPPPQQRLLWLRDVEEWTLGELAELYGCTRSTLQRRHHAARAALRAAARRAGFTPD